MNQIDVKVTRIGPRWHARLLDNNQVVDEMACASQSDIGWICREMLRWQDKLGSESPFVAAARQRHVTSPTGRIWYHAELKLEQKKAA